MGCEKCLGRPATLVAQHAQEVPLGVELRGITKFRHDFAGDAMNAHLRPARSLGMPWIRRLLQHSNHPQFLEQRRIERDLVDAVEDLTCTAGCAGPIHGVDLHQNRVARDAFAYERCDRRITGVTTIPQ